jgi:DNA replication protein DnaC
MSRPISPTCQCGVVKTEENTRTTKDRGYVRFRSQCKECERSGYEYGKRKSTEYLERMKKRHLRIVNLINNELKKRG